MRRLHLLLVLVFTTLSCGRPGNQDVLNSAGIQARRIENLWWLLFWVTLIVFILVMIALGKTVSRTEAAGLLREKPLSPDEHVDTRLRTGVMVAVAITIFTLFALLVAEISTGRAMAAFQSKTPLTIEVIGHQWWWEVHYPDPVASNIVVTANEIHIPVRTPVVMNSTSQDVIHSFWAPNIQGKRDLIPGRTRAIWFQADQEGVFRGQCAEFCGAQHAHMAFYVIAESPEKFQQWLRHQREAAPAPSTAEAQHGQQVFLSTTCMMCHTIRGTDAGSRNGPDLTHIASRGTLAAGTIPNNPGYLAGWIADPQHIKPGSNMPPNPLAPQDQQALVTYLESLQ